MADLTPVQAELPFQLTVKEPECSVLLDNVNRSWVIFKLWVLEYEIVHIKISTQNEFLSGNCNRWALTYTSVQ